MISQVAFNLLLNPACSFFAGLLIVYLSIKIFRIDQSRWKLFLLMLPFIKIIWDLFMRGIPSTSIIHAGINPLNLPPKHQTLTIGAGFSEYGPIFNLIFSAHTIDGKTYSASLADYLYALSSKHFGANTPQWLLIVLLAVSAFFLLRRTFAMWAFERKRRQQRQFDRTLDQIQVDWRMVDIYVSKGYEGTPFTGGVFRPYICFPEKTLAILSVEETHSVIRHEIAHIKYWDLLLTFLIKTMGDLLWFVPGYRFLSRKIDRLREILADKTATQLGASPMQLASALVKLKEIPEGYHHAVLHSAFLREKSLLKIRVEKLLEQIPSNNKSRFGWRWLPVRLIVTAWTTGAVMVATLAGNHDVKIQEIPDWLEKILKSMGWT